VGQTEPDADSRPVGMTTHRRYRSAQSSMPSDMPDRWL
jgi:hypothetical protein